jgi:DNA-binding CsgD family transcriptional regulator
MPHHQTECARSNVDAIPRDRPSETAPSAPCDAGPPPASNRMPRSSPAPSVVTFHLGDMQFAVLSVPLHDSKAMAGLTDAERQVATLAAAGLSNASIARCRQTSTRTVANQMAAIMRKLRVGSRYSLAARLAHCPVGPGGGRGV